MYAISEPLALVINILPQWPCPDYGELRSATHLAELQDILLEHEQKLQEAGTSSSVQILYPQSTTRMLQDARLTPLCPLIAGVIMLDVVVVDTVMVSPRTPSRMVLSAGFAIFPGMRSNNAGNYSGFFRPRISWIGSALRGPM
ncbi:unnamed protein product [Cuscuta europaea]|uniref:Uncharacterized protein n=1 Tax=Cuscuta europaea TaxID=41803 RepID=A0A9P0YUK0_CUSEU|nr:unnamed protein product [Cuscuta europaea]